MLKPQGRKPCGFSSHSAKTSKNRLERNLTVPNPSSMLSNARSYAPGIALCAVLALPCWLLGQAFPVIGGPVFAIILGMIIALAWNKRGCTQDGIKFTGKKVLQYAVILLGFGLNMMQIAQTGLSSLPVILSTIATSLIMAYVLCKLLNIPSRIATLVGVGSSICGGSAIAATAPVIKAKDEEIALAISVVFLFNVVACLVFPTLGGMLGLSNDGFALWAGTAINDTSSVTAAASAWDDLHPGANALAGATIVKLTRTLMIIPITFVLALWIARKEQAAAQSTDGAGADGSNANGFSLKRAFPMFIFWFIVATCITTLAGALGADMAVFEPFKLASKYMIVMAMMAIGLNTNVVTLVKSGGKPILLGFCCWVAIAAVSLGVQQLIGIW